MVLLTMKELLGSIELLVEVLVQVYQLDGSLSGVDVPYKQLLMAHHRSIIIRVKN